MGLLGLFLVLANYTPESHCGVLERGPYARIGDELDWAYVTPTA